MKLDEVSKNKGTYAGVKFSKNTIDAVQQYAKDNKIPKPLSSNDYHSTLLYSRKFLPNYKPAGTYDSPLEGVVGEFDVWDSQPDEKTGHVDKCLVMKYNCPKLKDRHEQLMDEHGATFDFPDFTPHITVSYDIGDMDITNLPKFDGKVEIESEYGEDLNLEWTKDK